MKRNILRTLIYADIFDYPLTLNEIHRRKHGGTRRKLAQAGGQARKDTKEALNQLISEGKLEKQDKYYFFPGRGKIIYLREKRGKYSQEKLNKAKKVANLIGFIPTVKFVGVTGSVASGNAKKRDDIDFFIIASSGWLWTTRFLVTLFLSFLGLRRRPNDKEVKDKICLNMFVDEAYLNVFNKNLFTAYELIQLEPLIDKDNIYQKLFVANGWVKSYFPNIPFFKKTKSSNYNNCSRSRTIVVKLWDKFVRIIQLWWMRNRKTSEITGPYLIAFHPEDISQQVLMEYQKRVEDEL